MFDLLRFQQLRKGTFGESFLFLEKIDSTNLIAIDQAKKRVVEGTVVFADRQTQGRGRGSHTWFSPEGVNIYVSIVLYPAQERLYRLPFLTALALSQTFEQWQIKCDLKWPNDILHRERKIAGILIQTSSEQNQVQFAIVGVGVNLNVEQFPEELNSIAVSAFQALGREIDRETFLAVFLSNLEHFYRGDESWDELMLRFSKRSTYFRDCEVEVDLGDRRIRGITAGVDRSGGLIVETPSGREIVYAGEVSSCRKK
jgi:BirA family biotin operon repressor/biotin-[acetyl-CoA-carboxylase] ligase